MCICITRRAKLVEQRRITLFFEGDLLARIDGDLPEAAGEIPPITQVPAAAPTSVVAQAAAATTQTQAPVREMRSNAPLPHPEETPSNQDAEVLRFLNAWADAWTRRDEGAYFAAYDSRFVPPDGGSRSDWEKNRRVLFGMTQKINIGVEAPRVERAKDGTAVVTFDQYYNADNYYDAVVKQLRMINRNGRWLIVEERVLSVLREGPQ